MGTSTFASETIEQPTSQARGCLFYVKRGLKWFGIILIAFVVLGLVYQTTATELDKRNFSPRGQLYSVNGHQMHMVCVGEGSPTVILQAGLSAESLWWYRVQTQLSQQTKVCAYDRPGLGWSEPASGTHDALTITRELHALLEQAGIFAPYVMAGHSYGAIWTRIYAAQYPQEVAGIVLVDSGLVIPKQFANQSEFDQWKTSTDVIQVLLWVIYRTGLKRLTAPSDFQKAGYSSDIALELAALQSANHVFDATYADQVPSYWTITQASAVAENLGNLPMVVLWASETDGMMRTIPALREPHNEIATYSSNSMTRVIEGADHGSILGSEQYAQEVSNAVLDVINAAQTGEPLTQ